MHISQSYHSQLYTHIPQSSVYNTQYPVTFLTSILHKIILLRTYVSKTLASQDLVKKLVVKCHKPKHRDCIHIYILQMMRLHDTCRIWLLSQASCKHGKLLIPSWVLSANVLRVIQQPWLTSRALSKSFTLILISSVVIVPRYCKGVSTHFTKCAKLMNKLSSHSVNVVLRLKDKKYM